MSQYPGYQRPAAPQESGALATTAFVLALVGLVIPLLGLVGLILGIVALAKGTPKKGLAIAGICVGGISPLLCATTIGIMIPALGQARQAARQIKSSTQARVISQALIVYAQNNKDAFPEPGADWEGRLVGGGLISREMLEAPGAAPGQKSYYYIPGRKSDFNSSAVLVYESPDLWRMPSGHTRGGNVVYVDNHVEWVAGDQYDALAKKLDAERAAAEAKAKR